MEKVKKGRNKNSEALMTEEMQWWGFLEMLDFNPMPGGVRMNSDKVKRNVSAVDRKSKTNFKKGRKAMKTKILTVTMLLLFLVSIPGNAGLKNVKAEEATEFAPGVLMVKFADGAKAQVEKKEGCVTTGITSIDALNRKHGVEEYIKVFSPEPKSEKGGSAYRELGLGRIYRFATGPEADVQAMVAEYEADPNVEYAEPDYVGHGHYTPNDPSFSVQWGLLNTGSNPPGHPGTADADIDATEVWDSWTPSRAVVVAILDTGVDLDHPDLRHPYNPFNGNIWINSGESPWGTPGVDDDGNGYVDDGVGFDFVNGTQSGGLWWNDADGPMDDHGHGTVNAGIVGARTDNGTGVAGLADGPVGAMWIMAVKVLDNTNWGLYSWWAEGLYYAASHEATHVINMSMGGTSFSSTLQSAVNYAWGQGCVVVASMGNSNTSTPEYPAAFTNTIAVGATDTDDSRCNPADWGTGKGSNFGSHIDVVAPGNWIYSTVWDDTYGYWSGTSMAAPFVSALAGIIMTEQRPQPSPDEVREFIRSTAEDQVGLWTEDVVGWDPYYGWGRINAHLAIEALSPPGDANGDGNIDIGDVVYLVNYLYKGGPAPEPLYSGDANSDGVIDIGDVVYLVNYLYKGGPPPSPASDRGRPANTAKPSAGSGHAEIWPVLNVDQNTATHTQSSGHGFDEVSEISVIGRLDVNVAGVELEVEFDPDQVTMLDPVLSPLTSELQLFAGAKDGTQKIGMVDLSGKNFLLPGEGALVTLRAQGNDLSSIKIKKATLVDLDARPLALELSGELDLEAAKGSESRPKRLSLSQNYPNPFNPRTSIRYALPQDAQVRLTIYNLLGQKITTLVDEQQSAGYRTVWWDGKDANGDDVSSGVYFYRLTAGEFSEVRKMMMVK